MFASLWKFVRWVAKALTNRIFSPVSGWVRTTGCSASGNFACRAWRCSIGRRAPKLASMECRARRSAIRVFTSSGSALYAAIMSTQMVSPPTAGPSTQRRTDPKGGHSRHVASQWKAFS